MDTKTYASETQSLFYFAQQIDFLRLVDVLRPVERGLAKSVN
jgi:hypothetical protein